MPEGPLPFRAQPRAPIVIPSVSTTAAIHGLKLTLNAVNVQFLCVSASPLSCCPCRDGRLGELQAGALDAAVFGVAALHGSASLNARENRIEGGALMMAHS